MPDHTHLLVSMNPDVAISDFTGIIKANSSAWLKKRFHSLSAFAWQEGFGAFSYSRSQLGDVIRYIENQQKHHTSKTFREEYVELLEKFEVEFDAKYIFKSWDD